MAFAYLRAWVSLPVFPYAYDIPGPVYSQSPGLGSIFCAEGDQASELQERPHGPCQVSLPSIDMHTVRTVCIVSNK